MRESLRRSLEFNGYEVDRRRRRGGAGRPSQQRRPDAVVMDVMMPRLDGLETAGAARGRQRLPILVLTARDAVGDRVAGLDAGADDYLPKPFALEELLARLRALLRRRTADDAAARDRATVLPFADLRSTPPPARCAAATGRSS